MKIGLLTFHYALNYGAVLQCWALKHCLEQRGHKVMLIDRIPNQNMDWRSRLGRLKSSVLPNKEVKSWLPFKTESKILLGEKTRRYNNTISIRNVIEYQFDAIVVGSDQVWRDEYTQADDNYFLDFLPKSASPKRISYAASFGIDSWKAMPERLEKIRDYLRRFDAISVRESSGVDICKTVFGVKAEQVLDPTMLLRIEDYKTIGQRLNAQTEGWTVSYFLGFSKEREEAKVFMEEWTKEHCMKYLDLYQLRRDTEYHYTVSDWLTAIKSAKYVITNSFHATIFAILARKQFVTIDLPYGGSARLHSLLSKLELNSRFVYSLSDIEYVLFQKINYDYIESRLDSLRNDSFNFLTKAGL